MSAREVWQEACERAHDVLFMRLRVSIRTRKREQEILRNAFELGRDFERERYHRRAS